MSVWVYKGEESDLIPAELLPAQLLAGWSVTRETEEETESVTEQVSIDDLSALQKPNDVRMKAKEAGIEGWDTKRIGTLEGLLYAHENRQD